MGAFSLQDVGVKFFQFVDEMGSACVSRAAYGVTPDAFGKCSQRDVANGDRDGRAPQHNIEHVQRPAALFHGNFLQRFDATESFVDFALR